MFGTGDPVCRAFPAAGYWPDRGDFSSPPFHSSVCRSEHSQERHASPQPFDTNVSQAYFLSSYFPPRLRRCFFPPPLSTRGRCWLQGRRCQRSAFFDKYLSGYAPFPLYPLPPPCTFRLAAMFTRFTTTHFSFPPPYEVFCTRVGFDVFTGPSGRLSSAGVLPYLLGSRRPKSFLVMVSRPLAFVAA